MILARTVLTSVTLLALAGAAAAAERCFTRAEQRAKAAAHAVVPLSRAMHAVRKHGELIHARLCERDGHLVYLLTVLGRDGKVAEADVDAVNGAALAALPPDKIDQDLKDPKDPKEPKDPKKAK